MNDGREDKLRAALAGLPDEMRRCFLLRYVQGFEESEIAILMKIPLEMVRMNLYQVLRWLRAGGAHGG
jgi:DNA-directed RNA polymerase specialized sigma24 family protein